MNNPLRYQIAALLENDGVPIREKLILPPKQVYLALKLLMQRMEQRYPQLLNLQEEPSSLPTAEDLARVIQPK